MSGNIRRIDPYAAQLQREADRARHKENSGRMAWAFKSYVTQGWGEVLLDEVADLQGGFVEMPFVSYGFYIDDQQFPDQDTDEDTPMPEGSVPRCTGGVHEWIRAGNLYVAAYVYVTVDRAYTSSVTEDYEVEHHFTFAGRAIKRVPRGNDNIGQL